MILKSEPSDSRFFDIWRRRHLAWLVRTVVFVLGVLIAGCASIPREYPRTPSKAFSDHLDTRVGMQVEAEASQHPGESGFTMIAHGRQAFTSRIALTDLAEKSLDMQYYIWESDATGRILAERLVRAADRGVRVRLLIDDITLASRDANVAAMDAHPNIEIRVFNPFANRGARLLDFVFDLGRVNHRMHNKLMVTDNAVAIVGGRNIGNDYFGVATDANFRDLDIAAVGPVVRQISDVFDSFWNGDWAVPIAALAQRPYTEADLQETRQAVSEWVAEHDYPYPLERDVAELRAQFESILEKLIWAPGKIIWDDPAAIKDGLRDGNVLEGIQKRIAMLQDALLIESAYFVMRDQSIETMKELNRRGVRVRVLTNSLSSNDVLAAHAGHAKRRKDMIENGMELYEYRADSRIRKLRGYPGESKAALHTKAMVFDQEAVFIGSFNLDPRSAAINTEAGVLVESRELASQLADYLEEGVSPENSYRVLLDENRRLVWVTEINGEEARFRHDPNSGFWERFFSGFIMLLPIEHQL